jgi:hypothetical protein
LAVVIKLEARAASRKIINSLAMNRQIKDATKNKKERIRALPRLEFRLQAAKRGLPIQAA